MKIAAVETIRLEEFGNLLWVQLHTDTGIIGLGETFFGPQAVEAAVRCILESDTSNEDSAHPCCSICLAPRTFRAGS